MPAGPRRQGARRAVAGVGHSSAATAVLGPAARADVPIALLHSRRHLLRRLRRRGGRADPDRLHVDKLPTTTPKRDEGGPVGAEAVLLTEADAVLIVPAHGADEMELLEDPPPL